MDMTAELEDGSIAYLEFEALYREVYKMCRNPEGIMEILSKELEELDKNTVQYMIDEMQDEINAQKDTIDFQQKQLAEMKELIKSLEERLAGR